MALKLDHSTNENTSTPEYLTIRKCAPSVLDCIKASPVTLSTQLYSRGYLSEYEWGVVNSENLSAPERAQKVLSAIVDRVKLNPKAYHELVCIVRNEGQWAVCYFDELQKTFSEFSAEVDGNKENDATSESELSFVSCNDSIGKDKKLSTPGFICPICQKCSMEQFFSEGCPELTESKAHTIQNLFPYLDISELGQEDQEELMCQLAREFQKVVRFYARLEESLINSLELRGIDVGRVENFAWNMVWSIAQADQGSEVSEKANSIVDIFVSLRPYKSFFNYEIVAEICNQFGSTEDKEQMKEYTAAFEEYCKRSVFEVPPKVFQNAAPGGNQKLYSFKYTSEKLFTLGDVQLLRRQIAAILGIKARALKLCSVQSGCVCLTFLVPWQAAEKISKASPAQLEALQRIHVAIEHSDGSQTVPRVPSARVSESKETKSSTLLLQLLQACKEGTFFNVAQLIRLGADANGTTNSALAVDYSPLLAACNSHGHQHKIVRLLLKKGANINIHDQIGRTPLLVAMERKAIDTCKLLIQKGALINECDQMGRSPILLASEKGLTSMVTILLARGAKVDHCNQYGVTPLIAACEKAFLKISKLLLKGGANINHSTQEGWSALLTACERGFLKIVQMLIKKGVDIDQCDKTGTSPLLIACKKGHSSVSSTLILEGANVNQCDKRGTSPLLAACDNSLVDIIKRLVNRGADVNQSDQNGRSPLLAACIRGLSKVGLLLVNNGADVHQCEESGKSPLLAACESSLVMVAKGLINKGADVNKCDENGRCPLLAACEMALPEITHFLLVQDGILVNVCDKNERTPLLLACQQGLKKTVECLVAKGADVNQCDLENEVSPLLAACEVGATEIVDLLIEEGAHLNHQDKNGRTPLSVALEKSFPDISQMLVDKGAGLDNEEHDEPHPSVELFSYLGSIRNLRSENDELLPCPSRRDSYELPLTHSLSPSNSTEFILSQQHRLKRRSSISGIPQPITFKRRGSFELARSSNLRRKGSFELARSSSFRRRGSVEPLRRLNPSPVSSIFMPRSYSFRGSTEGRYSYRHYERCPRPVISRAASSVGSCNSRKSYCE